MNYLAYEIGLTMFLITGLIIYHYDKQFKQVKVKTKNYLVYMRKVNNIKTKF